MLKISEFARLSRVSVKALRHYDELGLLRPATVDRFTGYRYYGMDQLSRLNRILALKDLGFSLEQVALLLDEELSLTQLRGMLRLKHAELQRRVQAEQERLACVEARLQQIEREGVLPSYDVVLRRVESMLIASARTQVPAHRDVGPILDTLFDTVDAWIEQHGARFAGPGIALWHELDQPGSGRDMDVEAAVPFVGQLSSDIQVQVCELPAVETMACVVHHGSFQGFREAYRAVLTWIVDNGYCIVRPSREVYLQYERGGDQSLYVTELQFPVEKGSDDSIEGEQR